MLPGSRPAVRFFSAGTTGGKVGESSVIARSGLHHILALREWVYKEAERIP